MSTRPNGSHTRPSFTDICAAPVRYALSRAALYPATAEIQGRWDDVMDWWHGSITAAELIRRTGWQVSELVRKGPPSEQ